MGCNQGSGHDFAAEDMRIKNFLQRVRHKLLIMSGKGGVGKSTVATQLALELSEQGYKVGLLDVDVHGPSVAGMLGLTGMSINVNGSKMEPLQYSDNLQVLTIQGMLRNADDPLIWRGPLKIGLIRQFLSDVAWNDLDYLIIDSPPGTGDEPLTIAQTIGDCKAIVVTTPQEVALADVRKSIHFCDSTNLQMVGIIENMSGFICPDCGSQHNIFASGGGEFTAKQMGKVFLGRLPIEPAIVEAADNGYKLDLRTSVAGKELKYIVAKIIQEVDMSMGEVKNKKVAMPIENGNLCEHFGHAEQFVVFTMQGDNIIEQEILTPPPHEPGVLPRWLIELKCTDVLVGGMGARAQEMLEAAGVNVYGGIRKGEPKELVQQWAAGTLLHGEITCNHEHEGCGGHGHSH